MNEAYEVFGYDAHDCGDLPHVIMSSMNETLLRNANDGVRTRFGRVEPFFYDNIHPGARRELALLSSTFNSGHQAFHRARSK